MKIHKNNLSRRDFIDNSIKGVGALAAYSMVKGTAQASPARDGNSKVVVVTNTNALSGKKINIQVAQSMMDRGIQELTGIQDLGEAWSSFFPVLTLQTIISIKVNTLFNTSFTHPEITQCAVNGLTRMQVGGTTFPPENIIIWDEDSGRLQSYGGYTLNSSTTGVRCFGTDGKRSTSTFKIHTTSQYLSKILTDTSDYLINLCMLKSHSMSGVSFSMKNHLGSTLNPGALHGSDSKCDPFIPALNALEPIRTKQKLLICDGIWGTKSGGPGGSPTDKPCKLVFGLDPVAFDYVCMQLLKDLGMSNTYVTRASHINTAAGEPYNLGTNDPANIDLINLDTTKVNQNDDENRLPQTFNLFQNFPNPFNSRTTLSFTVAKPSAVRIDVFDIKGELVNTLADNFYSNGYFSAHWDGTTTAGQKVASGSYLCRLTAGDFTRTIKMQLIQ
jgi:uncharacterized protein (DUF362 family)